MKSSVDHVVMSRDDSLYRMCPLSTSNVPLLLVMKYKSIPCIQWRVITICCKDSACRLSFNVLLEVSHAQNAANVVLFE